MVGCLEGGFRGLKGGGGARAVQGVYTRRELLIADLGYLTVSVPNIMHVRSFQPHIIYSLNTPPYIFRKIILTFP